jgi:LysM repeat protein
MRLDGRSVEGARLDCLPMKGGERTGGAVMSWLVCAAMAIGAVTRPGLAAAAPAGDAITYRVRAGDTLELIAAEFYGDRRYAVFVLVANKLQHPRPLRPGERLKIPVNRDVTTAPGDTLASLAQTYLSDPRRAPFLAEINHMPPDASLPAGTRIAIPFHVTHVAAAEERVASIAASYFGDTKNTELLTRYNFLDRPVVGKGETIVVPIFHVRVRESKLPPVDEEAAARTNKREQIAARAVTALPTAMAAWRDGNFAAVKRELADLDVDYLDSGLAVDISILLGAAYLAIDDEDSALARFKQALERKPRHSVSPYWFSPRVREVWLRAGGRVDPGP